MSPWPLAVLVRAPRSLTETVTKGLQSPAGAGQGAAWAQAEGWALEVELPQEAASAQSASSSDCSNRSSPPS